MATAPPANAARAAQGMISEWPHGTALWPSSHGVSVVIQWRDTSCIHQVIGGRARQHDESQRSGGDVPSPPAARLRPHQLSGSCRGTFISPGPTVAMAFVGVVDCPRGHRKRLKLPPLPILAVFISTLCECRGVVAADSLFIVPDSRPR